jgi:hypothetical protein
VGEGDPLAQFFRSIAGPGAKFGVLLGNPRAEGRRLVFLLFRDGSPIAIVKAGTTAKAQALISAERSFYKSVQLSGMPSLLGTAESSDFQALAMSYVEGEAPAADSSSAAVHRTLAPWIREEKVTALGSLPAWQRLSISAPEHAGVLARLGAMPVTETVMHGDFAPWNIRERDGQWTVLDWERGEIAGIPGWDWFHFYIQSALLVQRCSVDEIITKAKAMFTDSEFRAYAARCGITSIIESLFAAYCSYAVKVVRQTEGAEILTAVATAAWSRLAPSEG